MFGKNNSEFEAEEYGILSAIWILASKDENPIITYKSIRYRLGLPDSYDLEGLIKKHLELFRLKAPKHRVEQWKNQLREGKRRPAWLNELENEDLKIKAIDSLNVDSVFRSQFRTKIGSDPSSIEVINWGLEHIERLRKIKAVARDEKLRKWKEVWLPFASLLIAFATLILTGYWQYQNIQAQKQMKDFELSFKPKQEGYANLLQAIGTSSDIAMKNALVPQRLSKNDEELLNSLRKIDVNFFAIEPFLVSERKEQIWRKIREYELFLMHMHQENGSEWSENDKQDRINLSIEFSRFFREELNKGLFGQISISQ